MKTILSTAFCLLAFSLLSFQDDELTLNKGLPPDIKTAKVVFLRYDSVTVDAADKKSAYNQKKHNHNVKDANKEWAEAAKDYPYGYVIASRKDLDAMKAKGYKYFLDCQALKNMSTGTRNDKSTKNTITANYYVLYFQEIGTNNAWIVSNDFTENQLYFPKFIMKSHVIKAVKKADK